MNLNQFPGELLERVAGSIDVPKDLLSLALVNKHLSVLVKPYLQSWRIRCLTNNTAIWDKLASRPALCARIREIHLYHEFRDGVMNCRLPRDAIIPLDLLQETDLDIQTLWPQVPRIGWGKDSGTPWWASFKTIFRRSRENSPGPQLEHVNAVMVPGPEPTQAAQPQPPCSREESISSLCTILPLSQNLTKVALVFPMHRSLPLLNPHIMKHLLDSLLTHSSHSLRAIVIVWPWNDVRGIPKAKGVFTSLWMLSNLTLFHFHGRGFCLDDEDTDSLVDLLVNRCPNLEKLGLKVQTHTYPEDLWRKGTWNHLRSLHLGYNVDFEDRGGTWFRQFMARHRELECLEYRSQGRRSIPDLLSLNLKNIRALCLGRMLDLTKTKRRDFSGFIELSTSSDDVECHKRPKSTFENVEYLMTDHTNDGYLGFGKAYFPSLRVLIISRNLSYVGGVSCFFPDTLERLCINASLDNYTESFVEKFVHTLVAKPSPFKKLTHLCITVVRLFWCNTAVSRNEDCAVTHFQSKKIIKKFSTGLPSLKYFGLENGKGQASQAWIRIIRDSSGRYAGYEPDDSVEHVSEWYNFSGYM